MELSWLESKTQGAQLFWMEKHLRVAELSVRGDWRWALTLSYTVAPFDFTHDRSSFDTLEEAKEYTENLVRLLIIGGHHERN
jgi:transposase